MLFNGQIIYFFAHEAYVLSPEQISKGYADEDVSFFQPLSSASNLRVLAIISIVTGLLFGLAVFLKYSSSFQKIGQLIDRSTKFAPDLIRIVFGASLIFSANHNALFGPELPLDLFPGAEILRVLLYLSGAALIAGAYIKWFGWLSVLIYAYAFVFKGAYLLTYANYFGEALAVILLPRQHFSLDHARAKWRAKKTETSLSKYSMPVARIFLGLSLLYSAISVKILHPSLSMDVAVNYELSKFFHLDPSMIVLGAALTEILIAFLYILGFLQKVTSIIFVIFMTLPILYFKESVWPHYLLFGLAIGIFMHKPDFLALDSKSIKKLHKKKFS